MLFYLNNISDRESNIDYMQLIIAASCTMREEFMFLLYLSFFFLKNYYEFRVP